MGNRAVVVFDDVPDIGIYVHWNGGLGSVQAFLDEAKRRKIRSPKNDAVYAFGRFAQIVGEFFSYSGDRQPEYELSFGVGPLDQLDQEGDNGVYHVNSDFEISGRSSGHDGKESEYDRECRKMIGEFYVHLEACIIDGMAEAS